MTHLPTRQQILDFIASESSKVGKREIARAFQVSGAQRIELKRLLREMTAEGLIDGARQSGLHAPDELPKVGIIRITGRDSDGQLVARAVRQGELLNTPRITIDERPSRNRRNRSRMTLMHGDTVLARLRKQDDAHYIASPIRKIGEAAGQVIGVVRLRADGAWLIPADRRERYDYKLDSLGVADGREAADGDAVIAEKVSSSPARGVRKAKVTQSLGAADAPHAFSLIAIAEQSLPTIFPDKAVAEAQAISPPELATNDALSKLPFITIDPANARDHDDAVYAEPDSQESGGYIVWVAIADVARYVLPNSALDKEARKRGNSVYMPDRVVPMLPERLSTDLCSLREGAWRPVIALRMRVHSDGRVTAYQFYRGPIKVAARLTYRQAQAAFDGACEPQFAALDTPILQPLWCAYQLMAKARAARAPLDINKPEQRIEMDEHGQITRIYTPPRLEAHRLIEEMMVAANVCAATELEKHRQPLIYRIHDTPSNERVRALAEFVRPMGLRLTLGQTLLPTLFNKLMAQAKNSDNDAGLSDAVLRAQAQAVYSTENIGHFGLNLGRYAHFTSPIRRYSDLTVHRALIAALGFGDDGQNTEEATQLADIAEAISTTERRAMLAERAANSRYLAAYMAKQIGKSFTGRVSGASRAGLFVRLDDSGADGLVPISTLGHERFYVDDDNMQLTGSSTGVSFRLGQEVQIKLEEATPIQGGLLFSLAKGGTYKRERRVRPYLSKRKRGQRYR